jgi:NADH-quinone oxidoreductase subunit A
MFIEYAYIAIFFIGAFIISFVLIFISYFAVYQDYDLEKNSAYECGFQPFEDTRNKFNVRYYLIAILFMIFDLEIMYLFP